MDTREKRGYKREEKNQRKVKDTKEEGTPQMREMTRFLFEAGAIFVSLIFIQIILVQKENYTKVCFYFSYEFRLTFPQIKKTLYRCITCMKIGFCLYVRNSAQVRFQSEHFERILFVIFIVNLFLSVL